MLVETFASAVSTHNFFRYDKNIIDEMQKIAVDVSSKTLPDIEATADTTPKEVRSAKILAEQAAAIAQGAGRPYILWEDVAYAIELNFCSVYPFCKPQEP